MARKMGRYLPSNGQFMKIDWPGFGLRGFPFATCPLPQFLFDYFCSFRALTFGGGNLDAVIEHKTALFGGCDEAGGFLACHGTRVSLKTVTEGMPNWQTRSIKYGDKSTFYQVDNAGRRCHNLGALV